VNNTGKKIDKSYTIWAMWVVIQFRVLIRFLIHNKKRLIKGIRFSTQEANVFITLMESRGYVPAKS
jgi:hypothetical protein